MFGVTVADFADCGFVVVGGVGGFSCGFAWFWFVLVAVGICGCAYLCFAL